MSTPINMDLPLWHGGLPSNRWSRLGETLWCDAHWIQTSDDSSCVYKHVYAILLSPDMSHGWSPEWSRDVRGLSTIPSYCGDVLVAWLFVPVFSLLAFFGSSGNLPFSCSMFSSANSWLLSLDLKAVVSSCPTSFSWGWLFSSATILLSTWAYASASLVPSLGVNPRSRLALNRPCMGVPSNCSSVYELTPLSSILHRVFGVGKV